MPASRAIGTTIPFEPMRNRLAQNGKPDQALVFNSQAGLTRWLHEWTNGTIANNNEACAPTTPHGGTVGHDHSGGIFGNPLQVTLWSFALGYKSQTGVSQGVAPNVSVTTTNSDYVLFNHTCKTLWLPNCAPGGCYESMQLNLALNSDAAVNMKVQITSNQWTSAPTSFALSSGDNNISTFSPKIPMRPGFINFVNVKVTIYRDAADATVYLLAGVLDQTVTAP